jgi:hypothetical protein
VLWLDLKKIEDFFLLILFDKQPNNQATKQPSNQATKQSMQFVYGTRVILQTDVKSGRVGDECTVISSRNGRIKVMLNGADCILYVRKTQIKVI